MKKIILKVCEVVDESKDYKKGALTMYKHICATILVGLFCTGVVLGIESTQTAGSDLEVSCMSYKNLQGLLLDEKTYFKFLPSSLKVHMNQLMEARNLNNAILALNCNDELPSRESLTSGMLLSIAATNGNANAVRLVLAAHDDTEAVTVKGEAPLFSAAYNGQEEIVNLLLRAGADKNKVTPRGESPVNAAVKNDKAGALKRLLSVRSATELPDKEGLTPLVRAVCDNNEPLIEMLLTAQANKEALVAGTGQTLLSFAAEKGYAGVVRLLLVAGADVDKCNSDRLTPLYLAMLNKHAEIVESLLIACADPEKPDENGETLLHKACALGHSTVVEALLKLGVAINRGDNRGRRPCIMLHSTIK